jgi:hypothetical protein
MPPAVERIMLQAERLRLTLRSRQSKHLTVKVIPTLAPQLLVCANRSSVSGLAMSRFVLASLLVFLLTAP